MEVSTTRMAVVNGGSRRMGMRTKEKSGRSIALRVCGVESGE